MEKCRIESKNGYLMFFFRRNYVEFSFFFIVIKGVETERTDLKKELISYRS